MKANFIRVIPCLAAVLLLSGCREAAAPKNPATVFRLFDLFQPEDLAGKIAPGDAGWKRTEWAAAEMSPWSTAPKADDDEQAPPPPPPPSALGFHAVKNITGLKVDQGRLVGDLTGAAPLLQFSLRENRGGAADVKFIEIRMSVSGAKQVWLRSEGGPLPDPVPLEKWAAQSEEWKGAADVLEGKVETYRFEFPTTRARSRRDGDNPPGPDGPGGPGRGPGGAPPPPGGRPPGGGSGGNDFRQFFLTFRECQTGRVSIESVRFVSEREERLKDPSGQQWAGLADIFHAALVAKSPESIRIPVRELPPGARLDFSYGTKEDAPVQFRIAVSPRERTKASLAAPAVVFERTVTVPNRWQAARVDLSAHAGTSVLLEFSLEGAQKGLWGYWGSPTVRGRPAAAAKPGAARATRRTPRGVIVLLTDTLRKDHLNIYGYHRETVVHLKKFAAEGVAFSHAISQGTWTKVSVPSIMTSLYPLTSTVIDMEHSLPASARTLAEVFRDAGYATLAFSSVVFTGKANNMHQGYDELHESGSVSDRDYNAKTSRHYVDRLITWLKDHPDDPFFVFLHVFDPHSPFRPRPPYDTLWGAPGAKDRMVEIDAAIKKHKVANKFGLPHKDEYVAKTGNDPDELLKIYKDWYDGSIRGMDAEIGRLLEMLREMGLDQDTLMVWCADHGEEFWEHNQLFHGQSVYGELNQVPLVFRWPNGPQVRKGVMIDQQVENVDIMPTVLELAGLQGPTNMQGRSLRPLLDGTGAASWPERPAITQTMADTDPPPGSASSNKVQKTHFGIIQGRWKLVRKEVDPEALQELYAHPVDHLNLTNVIKADGPAAQVKPLHDTLAAWKARAQGAQLPNDESMTSQLSSEELRRLRALGYVGGGSTPKPATNKMAPTNSGPAGGSGPATNTSASQPATNSTADRKEGRQ